MTGFRLSLGGAQQLYGITPDLTTLGKILGGGLPCGAFGGRADIMDFLAPLGPVYQAGTLSGNPLAMAAGIATIAHLIEHESTIYPQLERVTKSIAEGVAELAREAGVPLTTNRVGSMFTWFFTAEPVTDYASAEHIRHRGLRALPPQPARVRRLAAAQPVRSRLCQHRPRAHGGRSHPRAPLAPHSFSEPCRSDADDLGLRSALQLRNIQLLHPHHGLHRLGMLDQLAESAPAQSATIGRICPSASRMRPRFRPAVSFDQ